MLFWKHCPNKTDTAVSGITIKCHLNTIDDINLLSVELILPKASLWTVVSFGYQKTLEDKKTTGSPETSLTAWGLAILEGSELSQIGSVNKYFSL